jgi:ribosome assembly protein YihI (activator of Der GTPase)
MIEDELSSFCSSTRERVSMNEERTLAKRTNYGFEKRQREIKKQKKKEAKAAQKREAAETSEHPGEEAVDGSPLGSSRPDSD